MERYHLEGVDIDDLIEAWRREKKKERRAEYLARDANNLFEPRRFTSLAVESEELRSPIRELREYLQPLGPRVEDWS